MTVSPDNTSAESHPQRRWNDVHPRSFHRLRTHADHGILSLGSLLRVTVVAVFGVTFLVQPFLIPTGSMEGTLLIGDCILVDHQHDAPSGHWSWLLPYRSPRHGDLIVFHYPVDPETLLVKRVVALPGDRLRLHEGHLLLNGQPIAEAYTTYHTAVHNTYRDEFPNLQDADPEAIATWWIELRNRMSNGELTIPANEYFVMGDNRNESLDSRYWGFVPTANIVGRPLLIYLSFRQSNLDGLPLLQRLRHLSRWHRTMLVPQ